MNRRARNLHRTTHRRLVVSAVFVLGLGAFLFTFSPMLSPLLQTNFRDLVPRETVSFFKRILGEPGLGQELSLLSYRRDLLEAPPSWPLAEMRWVFPPDSDPGASTPQSIALDGHELQILAPPANLQGSAVRHTLFTGFNSARAREQLRIRAVTLQPGESVLLLSQDVQGNEPVDQSATHTSAIDEEPTFNWEKEIEINLVVLGASPDRQDAMGQLSAEPIWSVKHEKDGGTRSLPLTEKIATASQDPATHFAISHVPMVQSVSLEEPMGPLVTRKSLKAVRLTWSAKSAGTLMILGRRRQEVAVEEKSNPGLLILAMQELKWPAPILENTSKSLQKIFPKERLFTMHEVWPETTDPVSSYLQLFHPEHVSADSHATAAGQPFVQLRNQYPRSLSVHIVEPGVTPEPLLPGQLAQSRPHLIIEQSSRGEVPAESLAHLASFAAAGALVDIHFWTQWMSIKHFSFGAYWKILMQGGSSALHIVSAFHRPDEVYKIQQAEHYLRLDKLSSTLTEMMPGENLADIAVSVARQTNILKREVIQLTHEIPLAYAPGYLTLGLALNDESPGQRPFLPLSESLANQSATTQAELWRQLADLRARALPSRIQREKGRRKEAHVESGVASALKMVARTDGAEGRLFVFNEGWIFLPTPLEISQKHAPIYGVPLHQLLRAKETIISSFWNRKQYRIDFRINPGGNTEGKDLAFELRSEYPLTQCSAPNLAELRYTTFETQGWVRFNMALESVRRPVTLSCLIRIDEENPIAKVQRQVARKSSAEPIKSEASSRVTLSLQASFNDQLIPTQSMYYGPYGQNLQVFEDNRSRMTIDLKKQLHRLFSLTGTRSPAHARDSREPTLEIAVFPGDQLAPGTMTDFRSELKVFLESRSRIAEKLRKNSF